MTVAALVVTACGGEPNRIDDESARARSIAQTEETTTLGQAERQDVIDGYMAATEAFARAIDVSEPSEPALEATHTGYQLEHVRAVLGELAEKGIVIEDPADSQSREVVTSVRFENDDERLRHLDGMGDVAVLEVCTVDDSGQVSRDTGEPLSKPGLDTLWTTAAMVKEDGTWKLSELLEDDFKPGVSACPGGT